MQGSTYGLYKSSPVDIGDNELVPLLTDSKGRLDINVRSYTKIVNVAKTLAAAGDYAAEDVLSENASTGTAWEFDIARIAGGTGTLTKAHILWNRTALTPAITLYLFNASPTSSLNDNTANTGVINADRGIYLGRIDFPALEDLGVRS